MMLQAEPTLVAIVSAPLLAASLGLLQGMSTTLARAERGFQRAQRLHDVLRLDATAVQGETPAAYGWHVDSVLRVQFTRTPYQPGAAQRAASDEPARGRGLPVTTGVQGRRPNPAPVLRRQAALGSL